MRQNDKELLLKDLCARLPYNVKCNVPIVNKTMTLTGKRLNYFCFHDEADGLDYSHEHEVVLDPFNNSNEIVKPYLQPISSLAKKEQIALGKLIGGASYNMLFTDFSYLKTLLEHVYKNHIDIFGLIQKGIAIKVTEENNPYKKNKVMKNWSATDNGKVEEIKIALLQLEKEHSISYSEEMEWLDNLKYRE